MVVANIWGPETVDPAWCYDTGSAALIFNVYDTLVRFYVNHSLPADQKGRTDQFTPALATEWKLNQQPHAAAPAYVASTYYFKIRTGVPYHDAAYGTVTPADVEYSFERWMAFDRSGGPTWMIYEPLLGVHAADWSNASWPQLIDNSVESNSTHVWFNLAKPGYPPMIFMQVIAQSWAGIMPKAWAADHGCWAGQTYTNASMTAYYDPTVSPFDDYPAGTGARVECGSGPYTLTNFDALGHTYRLDWFPDYYAGWPYEHANQYGYQGTCGYAEGWIKTVTFKGIDEWATRKTIFLAGDCDFCFVPTMNVPEMVTNWDENPGWTEEEYPPGIICWPGIPTMLETNLFPNFNISVTGNSFIGDPPHDQLHENGIPYWFFNDSEVRKGFAYCFNWTEYIEDVYIGEAIQPSSPLINGLAYWEYCWDVDELDLGPPDTVLPDPWSQPKLPNGSGPWHPNPFYYCNLTKAEQHFREAHNGGLWNKGFTFDILYTAGDEAGEVAARMLEETVEALNTKFHISVYEVDFPTYLNQLVSRRLTFFVLGWLADYPDPHNWFYPYMHSQGTFSYFQAYNDSEVDAMIEAGVTEPDDSTRIGIYWKLCNKYFEDAVSFPLVQPTGRQWERDWMQGWYYNPIYPGNYYYHMWKGYAADVNFDYVVNLFDLTIIGSAWDATPASGNWEACADIDGDGHVFLYDLTIVGAYYD
jgi:peptide/nickel transport system substrate-binding protein